VELASNAITNLSTVKEELKISISDTTVDSLLIRKINSFSDWLEKTLGRKLKFKNYIEKYVGSGRQKLILKQFPIIEINSIKVAGVTLDETDYELSDYDAESGIVFRDCGWEQSGYLVGYVGELIAPKRNIEINYDAGYVLPKDATTENPRTLPYDLEDLAVNLIAMDYTQNGNKGLKTFSVSDVSWSWENGLNQTYQAIIDRYKGRFL
jgi:hypothetical protein